MSEREDTPYWRHVTGNVDYLGKDLTELRPVIRTNVQGLVYNMHITNRVLEQTSGETFIFAGMGYNPKTKALVDMELTAWDFEADKAWINTRQQYELRKANILAHIDTLPTHYQFLKDNIYNVTK